MITLPETEASARAFVDELTTLSRAERAMLRRCAGEPPAEGLARVPWFYRLLGSEAHAHRHEEVYFLVATLFTLNPYPLHGDFGITLRRMKESGSEEAVARRFRILLDAEWEGSELAFRLRQLVKLAASREVGVDWPQLLGDLCQWHYANKPIQRRWAKSFYIAEREHASDAATTPMSQ